MRFTKIGLAALFLALAGTAFAADVKISNLPAATAADGTEVAPVVQGTTTKKMTTAQLRTYAQTGLAPVASSGSASDLSAGTLPAGRLPALSGDVSNSAGSASVNVKGAHWTVRAITNTDSPYTIVAADTVVTCDATAGTTTINLPAATGTGRYLDIKKLDATANACAITPAGGDTIDASASALNSTAQNANHWLIDSASGKWITGHRIALGGDLSGTSNAVTVAKVNGNTPGGTCSAQFVRSISSSAVPSCAAVALASDVAGTLPNANTTAASANTASAIVTRDASGNFTAGTITAALTGNVTGNASTASALAANGTNCSAGSAPLGVDASGNAETCTAYDASGAAASAQAASQPLDATLTALAAANWAANAFPIGSGADTLSQISFAANTFPARSSSGNLVAKTITDFGLSQIDDADAATGRATLGATTVGGNIFTLTNPGAITFLRMNADNSVTARSAANLKSDLSLVSSDVGLGSVTNNAQTQAAIVPNTAPSAGQILVGNAGGTAYAPVSASGDVTISSTGAHTLANNATARTDLGLDSNPSTLWTSNSSVVSLGNDNAAHSIFPAANDALTSPANTTWKFECDIYITNGNTTHTDAIGFGGTATHSSILYKTLSVRANTGVIATSMSSVNVTSASSTVIDATTTSTNVRIHLWGLDRITTGGTIIPQITFSADPTGTNQTEPNSWCAYTNLGSDTTVSNGPWN
jgi:hypothetical protein